MWKLWSGFFYLFSKNYAKKLRDLDAQLDPDRFKRVLALAGRMFPHFQKNHHYSLDELITEIRQQGQILVKRGKLTHTLLGIFVPKQGNVPQEMVILNEDKPEGVLLPTLGHEYGHFLAHQARLIRGSESVAPKFHYARVEDIIQCLNDPEELLADYFNVLGGYPQQTFVNAFCNSRREVRWIYRHLPVLLFCRALLYLRSHYSEISSGFLSSDNKFFHLCLAIHLIRVRLFVYETYAV